MRTPFVVAVEDLGYRSTARFTAQVCDMLDESVQISAAESLFIWQQMENEKGKLSFSRRKMELIGLVQLKCEIRMATHILTRVS